MRVALLSDVHANVHALAAVLEDVAGRGLSGSAYHLGDLVGYGAFPNETVALVAERGIAGVAGNYDSTIATGHPHCGCRYDDEEQARLSQIGYDWTRAHTGPEAVRRLAALPFRMDLRPEGGHRPGSRVVLVHGTPTLNTLYWDVDRPDSFCRKMGVAAGARPGDLVACGHTHVPWFREVDGVHYLNTGSVGRPKDGDWRACYAVVDLAGETPAVDFVRVEYDLGAATGAIRASELPDAFADHLERGGRSTKRYSSTTSS